MPVETEQLYLDTKEAARLLCVKPRTLMFWREKRRGPVFYRPGNKVLYKVEDLENFIASWYVEPQNQVSRRPNFLKGRTGV